MRFAVAVIWLTGSMIERMKKLLVNSMNATKISPATTAINPIISTCLSAVRRLGP